MTRRETLAKVTRLTTGLALGAFFLWLVFRGTDWRAVGRAVLGLQWGWVAISHGLLWMSHFARVQRWHYVVAAVRPTPFRSLLAAAQIGTLFNIVLPFRLGDAVRTFVLARLGRFPLSQTVAMVALDRLSELLGLLTVFAVTLAGFPMDRDLTLPAGAIGNAVPIVFSSRWVRSAVTSSGVALVVAAATLCAIHTTRERWRRHEPRSRFLATGLRMLLGFSEGLTALRSGGALLGAYGFTVMAWTFNAISLAALLSAFGIDYEWYVPFVLLVLLAAFIVAPLTPGLVGQFHLPLIAGLLLTVSGTALSEAKAFALVAHAGNLVPIVGLGVYCLLASGLSWRDLWIGSPAASGTPEGNRPAPPVEERADI